MNEVGAEPFPPVRVALREPHPKQARELENRRSRGAAAVGVSELDLGSGSSSSVCSRARMPWVFCLPGAGKSLCYQLPALLLPAPYPSSSRL